MSLKLDVLLKQGKCVFRTRDLGMLWEIGNDNTLYTLIKRYVSKGILIRIQKGLYTTRPFQKIEPMELATAFVDGYCYLSMEAILARNGIINQQSDLVTLVSTKSVKFEIGSWRFWSRRLDEKYLLNSVGIVRKGDSYEATMERAVADMLYFSPKYYFDNPRSVNWDEVKRIQKEVYGRIRTELSVVKSIVGENKTVKLWIESAKRNVEVAVGLYGLKHYDWSLFMWHLALEKTIKARMAGLGETVPLVHNLVTLCRAARIDLTEDEKRELSEINTYNVEARYEEIKLALYKKADKEYTDKWVGICRKFYMKFGGI